jgi:phosphoribosylformylglycinamidine synthase PurS subunit
VTFEALVEVRTLPGIADPEGATIESALPGLGFGDVSGVRVGKAIRLSVEAPDEASARRRVEELCHALLANPVMEEAQISLAGVAGAARGKTRR